MDNQIPLKNTKQLKEEADRLEQEARIAEAQRRIRDASYYPPVYPPYCPCPPTYWEPNYTWTSNT